jgi:hypothetical protein
MTKQLLGEVQTLNFIILQSEAASLVKYHGELRLALPETKTSTSLDALSLRVDPNLRCEGIHSSPPLLEPES